MKLNNELGFAELTECFFIENTEEFIDYIKKYNLPLIQVVGGLSFLAHTKKSSEHFLSLKKILNSKLSKEVYRELEVFPPLFQDDSYIDDASVQSLLEQELSISLIHSVAFTTPCGCEHKKTYWGLIYLFIILLDIDLPNFEIWLIKTKRKDMKIVFLDLIFSHIQNCSINLDGLDNSKMGILQSFYALCMYGLEPNSHNVWSRQSSNISSLFECNLSPKNKFIIYLKFITQKYHGYDLIKLDNDTEIEGLLKNLHSIKYNFTEAELIEATGIYYSAICLKIIQAMDKSNQNKSTFFESFMDRIVNYLKSRDIFNDYDVIQSHLLGRTSLEICSITKLETLFNKEYKELSFPYSFCLEKKWQQRISFCFHLLIGIYVYKKTKNEDVSEYLKKFNFIKVGTHHYFNEKIVELLKNMN